VLLTPGSLVGPERNLRILGVQLGVDLEDGLAPKHAWPFGLSDHLDTPYGYCGGGGAGVAYVDASFVPP
jgi:hypothetical protein